MGHNSALAALGQRLLQLKNLQIKIGIGDQKTSANGKNLAETAMEQEFGSQTNPPRAFMRTSIENRKAEWLRNFGKAAKSVVQNKADAQSEAQKLGTRIANDLASDTHHFADRLRRHDEKSASIINEIADSFESEP